MRVKNKVLGDGYYMRVFRLDVAMGMYSCVIDALVLTGFNSWHCMAKNTRGSDNKLGDNKDLFYSLLI